MPITIEMSLIDEPVEAIVSNLGQQGCAVANTSTTWEIANVQAKCDNMTLDSGLNESYIKLLDEGKTYTKLQQLHLSVSDNSEQHRLLYQHITVISSVEI